MVWTFAVNADRLSLLSLSKPSQKSNSMLRRHAFGFVDYIIYNTTSLLLNGWKMIHLWSHVVTTWSTCQPIQFKLPFLSIYNKSPSSFCKFLYIGYMLLVRVKTDPFANSQPWCGWSCVWPVCFLYFRGRLVFCLMKCPLNQKYIFYESSIKTFFKMIH